MPDLVGNLLVVVAVAVLAPLIVGYLPGLRVPAVVLESSAASSWAVGARSVHVDLPVSILALFGLAFLLFLAGLEIDVHHLRGRLLRYAVLGYLVSLGLGYGASASFKAAGWVSQPLLLAIIVASTALGLIVPVLKDARQLHREIGQTALAAASVADFTAIVLLSFFFLLLGREHRLEGRGARRVRGPRGRDRPGGVRHRPVHAARPGACPPAGHRRGSGFASLPAAGGVHGPRRAVRPREQSGAFWPGRSSAWSTATPPRTRSSASSWRRSATGSWCRCSSSAAVRLDLTGLLHSPSALVRVPVFLLALLVVRGLPALLRLRDGLKPTLALGLLQATSLPFIVTTTQIGVMLGKITPLTAAALVCAGLLSG